MKHLKFKSRSFDLINGVICYSPQELQDVINTYTLPARWTVLSRGMKLLIFGDDKSQSIVTPEYQAVLDYATGQGFTLPTADNQAAQNSLVADLKDAGIWDELDVFYNFLTDGDANFAKINWKAPGVNQASGGTYTPIYGLSGTPAILLNFDTATSVNFKQTNASTFFDLEQLSDTTINIFNDTQNLQSLSVQSGGVFQYRLNTPTTRNAVFTNTRPIPSSLYHVSYFSNGTRFYWEGLSIDSNTISSVAPVPIMNMFINPGIYKCFGAGASLSGKELALFNAWSTYKNP